MDIIPNSVKAFVLSPDQKMRSSELLPTLTTMGISFEIVDGSSVKDTLLYLAKRTSKISSRCMFTDEQLACTYGHMLMHECAVASDVEWAIFLENDATLDPILLGAILENLPNLPDGIIMLGSCGGWSFKKSCTDFSRIKLHKVFNSAVTGSHAYMIKASLLPEIIASECDLVSLADEFIRPSLPMYITLPFVSFQEGFTASEIPLPSGALHKGRLRACVSSLRADLSDLRRINRIGNRFLRLSFLQDFVSKFFLNLPGCNLYHSQIGSKRIQS